MVIVWSGLNGHWTRTFNSVLRSGNDNMLAVEKSVLGSWRSSGSRQAHMAFTVEFKLVTINNGIVRESMLTSSVDDLDNLVQNQEGSLGELATFYASISTVRT